MAKGLALHGGQNVVAGIKSGPRCFVRSRAASMQYNGGRHSSLAHAWRHVLQPHRGSEVKMQLAALALAGAALGTACASLASRGSELRPAYCLVCLCIFGNHSLPAPCCGLHSDQGGPGAVCCHRCGGALTCHRLKDVLQNGTLSVTLCKHALCCRGPLYLLQTHALSGKSVLWVRAGPQYTTRSRPLPASLCTHVPTEHHPDSPEW